MEIVNEIESALQHSKKTEVEQTREPSDNSNEPSSDSISPSLDSSETSGGSGKLSSDGSGQSGGDHQPSDDSSASFQTFEIIKSELSDSSAESSKKERQKQSGKLLNQMRNDNISNTEDLNIINTTSADQWLPDIPNNTGEHFDSSVTGVDGCEKFPVDSLNNNSSTSEMLFDVSKPTQESSLEGGKNDGGSDPSFNSDSSESNRFNLTRKSLPRVYAGQHCYKPNTSSQDHSSSVNQVDSNIKTSINQRDANIRTSMKQDEDNICTSTNDAEKNINNSSSRKRSRDRVRKSTSSSGQGPQSLWICTVYIVVPTVFVLIGVLGFWLFPSYISSKDGYDSSFDKFSAHIHEMRQNFPSQNHKLWRTFEASTRRILKNDVSEYPAVVLMASSKKHSSVTRCIARNISSAFDSSMGLSSGSSLIDFKDYRNLSPAEQKLQLDNTLNSALGNDKRKSFVLDNLQFLDPLAAFLFYKYCDNDYAPFKDVLIILALYFDGEKEKVDDAEAVENYLEMIWNKGLDVDKVKPLLSRVANNIVIVQGEGPEILNNQCL